MRLTLPPSAGFSLSHFLALINSSPPHPVRKQVCAELGPGPELGLSTPLLGPRGRRWGGGGGSCSVPTLVQASRQENPSAPSPTIVTNPYLIFQKPEDRGDQEYRTQLVLCIIFIKGKPPHPCASLAPRVFDSQGQATLGLAFLLPAVECKSWPRHEVWESQPPLDCEGPQQGSFGVHTSPILSRTC